MISAPPAPHTQPSVGAKHRRTPNNVYTCTQTYSVSHTYSWHSNDYYKKKTPAPYHHPQTHRAKKYRRVLVFNVFLSPPYNDARRAESRAFPTHSHLWVLTDTTPTNAILSPSTGGLLFRENSSNKRQPMALNKISVEN